jgi:hypothetical protein
MEPPVPRAGACVETPGARAGGGFQAAQALPGLPGLVDDVRIYDRALSAKEVRALCNAGQ